MFWRKIQNLNPVALGALNGTLFVLLIESVFRILYLQYLYEEQRLQASLTSNVHICTSFFTSFGFRWYSDLFIVFISVVAASFLISRSLPFLKKSSILFWQIAGFFTVAISIVLNSIRFSASEIIDCGKLNCREIPFGEIPEIYHQRMFQAAIFLAVVSSFNFLFALILSKRKTHLS